MVFRVRLVRVRIAFSCYVEIDCVAVCRYVGGASRVAPEKQSPAAWRVFLG